MDISFIVALVIAAMAAVESIWRYCKTRRQIMALLEVIRRQKKTTAYLERELQELRSQLIPNRVIVTAQSAFEPEALVHDGESYARYVIEALVSDLAHNWAEGIKHQLMGEVLAQLRYPSHDVASIQVRVPTIRADYDGIEVIAIDRMGRPFPLTDRSPLKRLQEEQEAAIAKAQLSSLDCIDERLAREMLSCLQKDGVLASALTGE